MYAVATLLICRSNRLLEKQGFKLEGRLLKAAFKDGQFCDSLVWALLRPPVQQVNSANDKRH
jgi:RimJ/RimL family protein N-acetyltransferase